jgi:hypothetical protein
MDMPRREWTADEDAVLHEQYRDVGPVLLAARLGRTTDSVRTRANDLGLTTRMYWTPAEEEVVRRDYQRQPLSELALALGRTAAAVAQKAAHLGVARRNQKRPAWTPEIEARYRALHAAGLCDNEIVPILGGDRPWLNAHRRRLGLPSNKNSQRYRDRMRKQLGDQLERAGVTTFAELRHRKTRQLNRQYGLPEDLALRELQIVLVLAGGPKTKSQICAVLGLSWQPGRAGQKSLHSGRTSNSYLGDLARRGLIVRVRLPGTGGKGPSVQGVEQNVYMLTAQAMDLLAKGGADARPETEG